MTQKLELEYKIKRIFSKHFPQLSIKIPQPFVPAPVFPQQQGYAQPQGGYVQPSGSYIQPSGGYVQPSGGYSQPLGSYSQPQQVLFS